MPPYLCHREAERHGGSGLPSPERPLSAQRNRSLSVTGATGDPVTPHWARTLANTVGQSPTGESGGAALDSSQVQVHPPHHFPAAPQQPEEVAGLTPTLQRRKEGAQ